MSVDKYKSKQANFFKKYWYINVIIIGIGFVFFIISINRESERNEKIMKEYPLLADNEELKGIIKESIKVVKGDGLRLELKSGIKKSLGWASNRQYAPESELCDFVERGDSIFKPSKSKEVYVYRNSKEYYFVLSQYLNQ